MNFCIHQDLFNRMEKLIIKGRDILSPLLLWSNSSNWPCLYRELFTSKERGTEIHGYLSLYRFPERLTLVSIYPDLLTFWPISAPIDTVSVLRSTKVGWSRSHSYGSSTQRKHQGNDLRNILVRTSDKVSDYLYFIHTRRIHCIGMHTYDLSHPSVQVIKSRHR